VLVAPRGARCWLVNETTNPVDFYEVLGIERTATQNEIKRAYRELAQKFHPDINSDPNAEARFRAITEANEVLSDPELRERYDTFGPEFRHVPEDIDPQMWAAAQRARQQPDASPPGWESVAGDQAFEEFLREAVWGQQRDRRGWGAIPGADQRASMSLSLEDAVHGGRRSLTLGGPHGERTIQVNIPAGVTDGQTIRLAGQGGQGTGGAPAGDLYLHVNIEPDARYRLSGRDIEVDLPVSPWEAALGVTLPVEGPRGTVTIKVPPGTSTDTKLRIRGQGMPTPRKHGDLYARVKIVVPKVSTPAEEDLYRRLGDISEFEPRSN
jgi:curved DNA-binding protein